jgi:cellulose biosynthesis protein BcsQ
LLPETGYPGRLDLIAGQFDLAKYALYFSASELSDCLRFFERSLASLRAEYDCIVLDTNPSVTFLNLCALGYSQLVLSPINPDKYATRGLRFLRTIENKTGRERQMPPRVVLINEVDLSNGAEARFVEDLRSGLYDDSIAGPAASERERQDRESRRVLRHSLPKSRYFRTGHARGPGPVSRLLCHQHGGFWLNRASNSLVAVAEELVEILELPDARTTKTR